ncbi:MAG TPA: hypothetical protein VGJ83_04215 [Gemmatimonadales bacterium]|jgi:hypothetical protein
MPVRPAPRAAALVAVLTIALACDAGLEPEPICARGLVGVCGTIRFRGTIPDSTENVFVAAYATFPQTCNDLIFNRQPFVPGSVPYTDTSAAYSVELAAGSYAWLVAAWKKLGPLHLDARDTAVLRVAGYYRDPADTSLPGVLSVTAGEAVGDVDIRVDFDSLRPATDFVTCTAQ